MPLRPRTLFLGLVLAAGCDPTAATTRTAEVPVLVLSDAPTLEIGVLEGDADFVFENVVSVLRTAAGNLVVADAGTSEILAYDPSGAIIRRWGGPGEGPGEFRNLARLYPRGSDSIMALDGRTGRLSLFDSAGTFSHQVAIRDLTSDTLFAMDVWLYGRFWVDGALHEGQRAVARAALDRLPSPTSGPGYRFVRVAENGDLWIREPDLEAGETRTWTIVDPADGPRGVIRIPVRFDPQTLGDGFVLGRWLGESDVHFVRSYGVGDAGTRAPLPAWMRPTRPPATIDAADQDTFMDDIRGASRGMARAQEIHYSTAMTYTTRLDSLEWERPEAMVVDVIDAGRRGWVAVFTHPGLDQVCGLAYGFTVPPGWAPGSVLCGPPGTPDSATGR